MILAGHETTATALFWSLYLLALDPATQDELAEEAKGALAGGPLDATRLTFTRAVLDETMRLYPPAFLIVRAAAGPDGARRRYREEGCGADFALVAAPA
jgi:cytochrome P450